MGKPVNDMEGGFRLDRIRRIRNWLYTVQLVIIVVFVIALMYFDGEFSIVPFHLGVPSFLYFVLFMVVVISIEGVVFIRLETRFLKSPSSKYYLLKKAIRRYFAVIIITAIILLLFLLPLVNDTIKDLSESEKEYTVTSSANPVAIAFYNSDVLGMTNINSLSIYTDGGVVWAFIVSEDDYEDYLAKGMTILGSYRINTDVFEAHPGMEYSIPDLHYGKYYLCLYSPDDSSVSATVVTDHELSEQLIGYVPIFCVIIIVMNVLWILYLRPIRKLFENRAIYR